MPLKNRPKKEYTKLYVYSLGAPYSLTEKEILYLIMSNHCFPTRVLKLSKFNYIINVEYDNHTDLLKLMNIKKTYFDKTIAIKRVFKSIRIKKDINVPRKSFLMQVIMGVSGLIKKPVIIKVDDNRAETWRRELLTMWQKELDNPDKFKKAGINPVIDIAPDGKIKFHITKTGNYIVTFFEQNVDDLV
jgi:hypothetical protein